MPTRANPVPNTVDYPNLNVNDWEVLKAVYHHVAKANSITYTVKDMEGLMSRLRFTLHVPTTKHKRNVIWTRGDQAVPAPRAHRANRTDLRHFNKNFKKAFDSPAFPVFFL